MVAAVTVEMKNSVEAEFRKNLSIRPSFEYA
jgi:hypothetical protein